MSRSRSRSPEPRYAEEEDRRERDRPEPNEEDEQPAKRQRAAAQKEDRARGKRLFGNILGTLQKFQKEDKTSRKSAAVSDTSNQTSQGKRKKLTNIQAQRREEISEKIQNKIRSEATLHHEIAESERELKALRIGTDSAEFVLKHKEAAIIARHKSLKPISHFLSTAPPVPAPLIFDGNLLNPSPIPLNKGPTREPPQPDLLRPLYFLPKILLPHQHSTLESRIANVAELITEETASLSKEKDSTTETCKRNRARIEELSRRLAELRAQVKPERRDRDRDRGRDDFGRTPRDEMEVDGDRGASPRVKEELRDREEGVQIRGEDGDVEVEY